MKILDFPELIQAYNWDCGAKALQAVLAYYGIKMREESIIKNAKTNQKEGTNMSIPLKICKKNVMFNL